MNPTNVTAYTRQWNLNMQHTFGGDFVVEVAYTGQPRRKRAQAVQCQSATRGHRAASPSVCRIPAFASRILTSDDTGPRWIRGAVAACWTSATRGSVLHRQLPDLRQQGQWVRRGGGQRHRVCVGSRSRLGATRGITSAIAARSASVTSCRSATGKRWLADGGALAYVLGNWQVAGVVPCQQRPALHGVGERDADAGQLRPQPGQFRARS